MAVERSHYKDRPQALVKHTFLNEYLSALVNKVCSTWNTFVYIDGFAGPWQAADEVTFSDTSFGIALKAMTDAQIFQRNSRNRSVRMIAHLVEMDDSAFAKLSQLEAQFPNIEVHTYNGEFHSQLPNILSSLRKIDAFSFAFVDPKGVSLDLSMLQPLLQRGSSEVLVNFMFDFVNRFVSHPNQNIVETMNRLIPGAEWRNLLDVANAVGATSDVREEILLDAFREALRTAGNFSFVTSLVVQKPLADRTLYHLVFGTRSKEGLSVFRDSQVKALKTQAETRASEKAKARSSKSGQGDFFGGADAIQIDPSSLEIESGQAEAKKLALELIQSRTSGIQWSELWPAVLEKCTIREIELARLIFAMNKDGLVSAPGWRTDRYTKPDSKQMFMTAQWNGTDHR